jgi:two-component system, chemotaxis family, CheB/CheR fusion protein
MAKKAKKTVGESAPKSKALKKPTAQIRPDVSNRGQTKPRPPKEKQEKVGFPIAALGASAGGLEAFEIFFKAMRHDSGIAFVLVAHLDPTHVSLLPELVQKRTKMHVHQVRDGMKVQRNHVYVIPPNKDLTILNGILQLMDLKQPRGANLPIDSFFRSLAKDQGPNAVCIILSGTGTDGTLGLKAIKGEVGMVMVQSVESAKYDGMPHSAISTGLTDYVLSPEKMPEQLIKYTQHASFKISPSIAPSDGMTPNALAKIYIILRTQTDHDFSLYKKNTICRRIERRMNVHQIDEIADYARYLQGSEAEVHILFKELLIGVTNFFRDAAAFDALRDSILFKSLEDKPDDYTIRVWIPGCSSGEEAYSLAIILQECMEQMKRHFSVQIFGTDIDDDSINIARVGLYPESILADVSPERLSRYFIKEEDGQYRVKKSIREMLVFAPQNVIKDPPFTKLDILSCRNLLIYLAPELQRKLLPIFHYSLNQDGILFLGSSETTGQSSELFAVLDKKWKIFRRHPSNKIPHHMLAFPMRPAVVQIEEEIPASIRRAEEISALQLVETILHQSNMPPCAIIDDNCNVVYIHGRTGRFLEPAEGKISINLLEMARPGLKVDMAAAIRKVTIHKQEVIHRGLRIEHTDGHRYLDLSVRPILESSALRGLMMVVFQETEKPSKSIIQKRQSIIKTGKSKTIEGLEQELQYTKENLQTTIEELETSNEELKSTNEELQSTNEELQSTNEEMETSKEELQSLNEESATVNAELQSRIDELSAANDDMKNLLDSTAIATMFLDTDLCIRRFTPKLTEIIPLAGSDSGRPIEHFATKLIGTNLTEYGKQVLEDLAVREAEVQDQQGRIYAMKVRPYRTVANVIDGVVITFEDITKRRQTEEELKRSAAQFSTAFQNSPMLMSISVVENGNYLAVNDSFTRLTGFSREDALDSTSVDLGLISKQDRNLIKRTLQTDGKVCGLELKLRKKSGEEFWCSYYGEFVTDGDEQRLFSFAMDITERMQKKRK